MLAILTSSSTENLRVHSRRQCQRSSRRHYTRTEISQLHRNYIRWSNPQRSVTPLLRHHHQQQNSLRRQF